MVQLIYKRLKKSQFLNNIVFSIPTNKENKELELHLIENHINYFKGSEKNVFDRYVKTAKKFKADIIVRITSDCPLVDPKILDKMIKVFKKKKIRIFC